MEIGNLVFRRLLPASIQDVLAKLDHGYLAIATDDPGILWEAAFFNEAFLGLRFAVARRLVAKRLPDPPPRSERPSLEMLVIADPRGDLRQARSEADAIKGLFEEELTRPGTRPRWRRRVGRERARPSEQSTVRHRPLRRTRRCARVGRSDPATGGRRTDSFVPPDRVGPRRTDGLRSAADRVHQRLLFRSPRERGGGEPPFCG